MLCVHVVFPVLLVCNLVSYSEPIFLAFTIGAYDYWKREVCIRGAACDIFHFYAPSRRVHPCHFSSRHAHGYVSHRERSRVIRQLAVIVITCAGVAMLYLFYLYRFGNPFIVSRVEAAYWLVSFSVANIFHNVGVLGFGGPGFLLWPRLLPFNYAVVPIFLIDTLLVVATILALLKRDLALSAYSFVSLAVFLSEISWPNSFVRYIAAIFPLYIFLGLMLSDNWQKNIVIGVIAVVIAIQNMFVWISGAWLY